MGYIHERGFLLVKATKEGVVPQQLRTVPEVQSAWHSGVRQSALGSVQLALFQKIPRREMAGSRDVQGPLEGRSSHIHDEDNITATLRLEERGHRQGHTRPSIDREEVPRYVYWRWEPRRVGKAELRRVSAVHS